MRFLVSIGAAAAAMVAVPAVSAAFCGFYVSGADAELYNNATQVVMMREGTRTVLSMQNNYQGPPSDFAMVVPVPVVLQKENVKTLPREIFRKVDSLSAPRLVEYWEQDPCMQRMEMEEGAVAKSAPPSPAPSGGASARDLGVTIEAKFTVGEYQIVILSAKDSTGLDTWLRQEKYKIPDGAEPYLKPYVEGGSKFFVARIGRVNSAGTQDLLVSILAPGQRYEVANYPNVTIPTNLDVREEARGRFGEFYAALFDRTLEKNPGAVVTEYAWDASSCDPCPTPALDPGELSTLGADVVRGGPGGPGGIGGGGGARPGRSRGGFIGGFVLTRLHARYGKDGIREDLVFKAAPPIAGGREWRGPDGKLEERAAPYTMNNFQGRYAIRHEWTGPIACANPVRGVWGGPPAGQQIAADAGQPRPALDLAFVPRGKAQLAQIVRQDVPEIGLVIDPKAAPPATDAPPATSGSTPADEGAPPTAERPVKREKKGCAAGGPDGSWLAVLLAGLFAIGARGARGHRRSPHA